MRLKACEASWKGRKKTSLGCYLGECPCGELLHECAGDNGQVVDGARLQGLEVVLLQVGGAVVLGEVAGEAVEVEVVVCPEVGVASDTIKSSGSIV